jgi:aspartyl-tRNA(Asn)/glutamyl-tRNA(Gln) amidotransferase subunit A
MKQQVERTDAGAKVGGEVSRRDFMLMTAAAAATLGFGGREALAAGTEAKSDLAFLTIAEASRKIHAHEITSTELVTACIARTKMLNPKVNAVITLMHEEALAQAAQLDKEARAGNFRGAMHGIPVALKDNIDTAGTRTTGGSAVYADRFPEEDAFVVKRLKANGAIILQKANLQEFAMGGTSTSTYFRPVRNPWGLEYEAGGSSGGSAAAVMSDITIGALGTDTGGSVRMPASICGIVGLKATYGLVSIHGIIPRTYSLDHCGPMTKTCEDNAILLNAMTGYDKWDVASVDHAKEDYVAALRQPVSGFRVGVARVPFFDFLDPEVSAAMEQAIGVLTGLTKSVKDMHLPTEGNFSRSYLDGEIEVIHRDLYARKAGSYSISQRHQIEGAHKRLNDTSTETCGYKVVDYIQAQWDLQILRKTIDDAFVDYDVVVLPTMRGLPLTVNAALAREEGSGEGGGEEPASSSNTSEFNAYGIPSLTLPCGFSASGLPIGMMIVGPRFSEGKVLAMGHAYEQATEWHKKRPKLSADMAVPPIKRKGGTDLLGLR